MNKNDSKVIGFAAKETGTRRMLCIGDGCIVASTEEKLDEYIKRKSKLERGKFQISKVRYGQLFVILQVKAAYLFDEESYAKFSVLALEEGLNLDKITKNMEVVSGVDVTKFKKVKLI